MKKIEAIIKPMWVERVKDALTKLGVDGMTLSDVRGLERPKVRARKSDRTNGSATFLPEVKIEVVVTDLDATAAVAAVIKNGRAGRNRDGKIFVSHVEQAVRIRTEERGDAAIAAPTTGNIQHSTFNAEHSVECRIAAPNIGR